MRANCPKKSSWNQHENLWTRPSASLPFVPLSWCSPSPGITRVINDCLVLGVFPGGFWKSHRPPPPLQAIPWSYLFEKLQTCLKFSFPVKNHWKDCSPTVAWPPQHEQPAGSISVSVQKLITVQKPSTESCQWPSHCSWQWKDFYFVSRWFVCRIWYHRATYSPFSPWIFIRHLWNSSCMVQILSLIHIWRCRRTG